MREATAEHDLSRPQRWQQLTAQRILERTLPYHADRLAVVDGDRRLTYAGLGERSARLGNVLLSLSNGDRPCAAVLLPSSLEFVEVDVACGRTGLTRVGISERLSADECRYILEHCRARALITNAEFLDRLDGVLPDCLAGVLLVGPGGFPHDVRAVDGRRTMSYEHAIADASARLAAPAVDPDDPSYILYTSGTTGRPKGATHTHGARVASMLNMIASELVVDAGSVMVHAGPLTHGSGSKLITFLAIGGTNVVLPQFSPEALRDAVRDHGGSHTFAVPTMLQRLADAGGDVVDVVRTMRQISFGGSPISPALYARSLDTFGPILTQVYGSSEAPHPITVLTSAQLEQDRSERMLRSAGRVALGADLRLVDEAGDDVPVGTVGELLVRASHLMRGYWEDDAATAEVLDADHWYHSGDLAFVDDDGFVTFHDRKRDLIISGGLNVYPSEVERVLGEHPGVGEVAVVGRPDEEWGEAVVAYVVPLSPGACSEGDLIAWTRDRLAGYKKPRQIEFVESLPRGSTNKVLKTALRERLWHGRVRRVN
jgi:acyl-CoA synthetase (AMP-forming)/AMP-acid ligase II